MAEMRAVKLHYKVADKLGAYLDRAGISYTLEPMTENPYYYAVQFDDSPNGIVYRTVERWLDMRRRGLKYCPFCGGIPKIVEDQGVFVVSCIECGVNTPWFLDEIDAIAAWNERFEDEGD